MEALESMRILAQAGRGDEARRVVQKHADTASRGYAAISTDVSRSDEFKREEIARIHDDAKTSVASELERLARSAKEKSATDAASLFGTAGLSGDPASLAISRRDAGDRVAGAKDRSELQSILDRANRSGDEVLARAVAEKAYDNQDVDTLNRFLDTRPHLNDAAQRLWDSIDNSGLTQSMQWAFELAALQPPRL